MPRPYVLHPNSFSAPGRFSRCLHISFTRGCESRDPIFPASTLQVSFSRPADSQEIFIPQHFHASDVTFNDTGLCTLEVEPALLPHYAPLRIEQGEEPEDENGLVVVRLHAWKGEKHLGAFEVGRITARGVSEGVARPGCLGGEKGDPMRWEDFADGRGSVGI